MEPETENGQFSLNFLLLYFEEPFENNIQEIEFSFEWSEEEVHPLPRKFHPLCIV